MYFEGKARVIRWGLNTGSERRGVGYNPKDMGLNGDAISYTGEDPRRAEYPGWTLGFGCGAVHSGWRYTVGRWFSEPGAEERGPVRMELET